MNIRKLFLNIRNILFYIRRCQFSGRYRKMSKRVISLQTLHRLLYLSIQKPQHTYAIFQLQISIVLFFRRHALLCQDIPFVTAMNKMQAIFSIQHFLPSVNAFQHILSIFFCKWLQWVQTIPVFTQSNRNDRDASKMRQISAEIPDTPFQFLSVIHAFTQNNLTIHFNSGFV